MRVITVKPLIIDGMERDIHMDGTRTLPLKKKGNQDPTYIHDTLLGCRQL